MIAHMARVSNPASRESDPSEKLIQYLLVHKHFSPFEMACMCVEIETTRDIARQILRHRSFHFQEFSQRYAEVPWDPEFAETRLQDLKNRQNSIPTDNHDLDYWWKWIQLKTWETDLASYKEALSRGIAKELARKLLPEGLTRTKMYMQGTIRDWLHYVGIRASTETQKEHRDVAWAIYNILKEQVPTIWVSAISAGILSEYTE